MVLEKEADFPGRSATSIHNREFIPDKRFHKLINYDPAFHPDSDAELYWVSIRKRSKVTQQDVSKGIDKQGIWWKSDNSKNALRLEHLRIPGATEEEDPYVAEDLEYLDLIKDLGFAEDPEDAGEKMPLTDVSEEDESEDVSEEDESEDVSEETESEDVSEEDESEDVPEEDVPEEDESEDDELEYVTEDEILYAYHQYDGTIAPTKWHSQLCDLVLCTSDDKVFYSDGKSINLWTPSTLNNEIVWNAPESFQITCFTLETPMLVMGSLNGELYFYNIETKKSKRVFMCSEDIDNVTTSVSYFGSDVMKGVFIASNNDAYVRMYNKESFTETFKCHSKSNIEEGEYGRGQMNCVQFAPKSRKYLIFGCDNSLIVLFDLGDYKIIGPRSQGDCNSIAWHQDEKFVATATSDHFIRLYEVKKSIFQVVQKFRTAWRRSLVLKFSEDLLVVGEDDFVTIYRLVGRLKTIQRISFFGDIAGISFSPNQASLFIGIHDVQNSLCGMLEYRKISKTEGSSSSCLGPKPKMEKDRKGKRKLEEFLSER